MTPIGDVLDPEGEVAVEGVKESGSVLWGPWYGGGGFIPVPSKLLFLEDLQLIYQNKISLEYIRNNTN